MVFLRRKNFLFFFLSLCSILLIFTLDQGGFLYRPKTILLSLSGPLVKDSNQAISFLTRPFKILINLQEKDELLKELRKNQLTVQELKIENQELFKENQLLRKALGLAQKKKFSLVPCQIIAWHPDSSRETLLLNQGKKKGIRVNQAVVFPEMSVVGKVVEVFEDKAQVLLINDVNFSAAGISENSRIRGLVRGKLDHLEMEILPDEEGLKIGETILTSGIDNIFPPGLILGHLTKIIKEPAALLKTGWLRTGVDLENLEKVFVITNW